MDFSVTPTDVLIQYAKNCSELANALADRLELNHGPERMARFFPASISPTPDLRYAKRYGQQTVDDVRTCADAVLYSAELAEELAKRRYPN